MRRMPDAQLLFPFSRVATVTLRLNADGQRIPLQQPVRRPVEARRQIWGQRVIRPVGCRIALGQQLEDVVNTASGVGKAVVR